MRIVVRRIYTWHTHITALERRGVLELEVEKRWFNGGAHRLSNVRWKNLRRTQNMPKYTLRCRMVSWSDGNYIHYTCHKRSERIKIVIDDTNGPLNGENVCVPLWVRSSLHQHTLVIKRMKQRRTNCTYEKNDRIPSLCICSREVYAQRNHTTRACGR